jgi:hypothetical protein
MPMERQDSERSRVAWSFAPLLILLALDVAATTVWTWVDKDGIRHYSQTPAPGATRLEIGPSNRAAAYVDTASPPTEQPRAATPVVSAKYTEFAITRPAQDEAVINTGGVVPVSVRLTPALRPGHGLSFYLDDRPVASAAAAATSFELKDVPRGTHLLVAVVHDQQRAPLQEAAVTFHVRQTSVAQPPGPLKPAQPLPKEPR